MTPYAVLLVRPQDTDLTIRQRYHALITDQHPDRAGAAGVPGPKWFAYTTAYSAIKTQTARNQWFTLRKLRRACPACKGYGVTGSRVAGSKLVVCVTCAGQGLVQ